jgi:hypothetical protein
MFLGSAIVRLQVNTFALGKCSVIVFFFTYSHNIPDLLGQSSVLHHLLYVQIQTLAISNAVDKEVLSRRPQL